MQFPKIAGDRADFQASLLPSDHNLESRLARSPNSCRLVSKGRSRIAVFIGNGRHAEKRGGSCLPCLYSSYAPDVAAGGRNDFVVELKLRYSEVSTLL